jgi:hypothetical protein
MLGRRTKNQDGEQGDNDRPYDVPSHAAGRTQMPKCNAAVHRLIELEVGTADLHRSQSRAISTTGDQSHDGPEDLHRGVCTDFNRKTALCSAALETEGGVSGGSNQRVLCSDATAAYTRHAVFHRPSSRKVEASVRMG